MADGESYGNRVAFAWDIGIRDAIVEGDFKIVTGTVLGLYIPSVVVFNVLVGLAHMLKDFRSVQISHVKSQDNKLAHLLAKFVEEIDNIDNYII